MANTTNYDSSGISFCQNSENKKGIDFLYCGGLLGMYEKGETTASGTESDTSLSIGNKHVKLVAPQDKITLDIGANSKSIGAITMTTNTGSRDAELIFSKQCFSAEAGRVIIAAKDCKGLTLVSNTQNRFYMGQYGSNGPFPQLCLSMFSHKIRICSGVYTVVPSLGLQIAEYGLITLEECGISLANRKYNSSLTLTGNDIQAISCGNTLTFCKNTLKAECPLVIQGNNGDASLTLNTNAELTASSINLTATGNVKISGGKLCINAPVTFADISAGSITSTGNIDATGNVTANEVNANVIRATGENGRIGAHDINSCTLITGSITSCSLNTGCITASDHIEAHTINVCELTVGSINQTDNLVVITSRGDITSCTLTADTITATTITATGRLSVPALNAPTVTANKVVTPLIETAEPLVIQTSKSTQPVTIKGNNINLTTPDGELTLPTFTNSQMKNASFRYIELDAKHVPSGVLKNITMLSRSTGSSALVQYIGVWELGEDNNTWTYLGSSENSNTQVNGQVEQWNFAAGIHLAGRKIRILPQAAPSSTWAPDRDMGAQVITTPEGDSSLMWREDPYDFLPSLSITVQAEGNISLEASAVSLGPDTAPITYSNGSILWDGPGCLNLASAGKFSIQSGTNSVLGVNGELRLFGCCLNIQGTEFYLLTNKEGDNAAYIKALSTESSDTMYIHAGYDLQISSCTIGISSAQSVVISASDDTASIDVSNGGITARTVNVEPIVMRVDNANNTAVTSLNLGNAATLRAADATLTLGCGNKITLSSPSSVNITSNTITTDINGPINVSGQSINLSSAQGDTKVQVLYNTSYFEIKGTGNGTFTMDENGAVHISANATSYSPLVVEPGNLLYRNSPDAAYETFDFAQIANAVANIPETDELSKIVMICGNYITFTAPGTEQEAARLTLSSCESQASTELLAPNALHLIGDTYICRNTTSSATGVAVLNIAPGIIGYKADETLDAYTTFDLAKANSVVNALSNVTQPKDDTIRISAPSGGDGTSYLTLSSCRATPAELFTASKLNLGSNQGITLSTDAGNLCTQSAATTYIKGARVCINGESNITLQTNTDVVVLAGQGMSITGKNPSTGSYTTPLMLEPGRIAYRNSNTDPYTTIDLASLSSGGSSLDFVEQTETANILKSPGTNPSSIAICQNGMVLNTITAAGDSGTRIVMQNKPAEYSGFFASGMVALCGATIKLGARNEMYIDLPTIYLCKNATINTLDHKLAIHSTSSVEITAESTTLIQKNTEVHPLQLIPGKIAYKSQKNNDPWKVIDLDTLAAGSGAGSSTPQSIYMQIDVPQQTTIPAIDDLQPNTWVYADGKNLMFYANSWVRHLTPDLDTRNVYDTGTVYIAMRNSLGELYSTTFFKDMFPAPMENKVLYKDTTLITRYLNECQNAQQALTAILYTWKVIPIPSLDTAVQGLTCKALLVSLEPYYGYGTSLASLQSETSDEPSGEEPTDVNV